MEDIENAGSLPLLYDQRFFVMREKMKDTIFIHGPLKEKI